MRPEQNTDILGIARTTFTWSKERVGSTPATPGTAEGRSQRRFALNIEDEVIFKPGSINLVVGPTGSGKTSLLMALLGQSFDLILLLGRALGLMNVPGEMHAIPSGPDAFVSLPRTGGVAYAAQESWIMSETIRVWFFLSPSLQNS